MAPEGTGKADVVILEGKGNALTTSNGVEIALGILSSGRANSLVVVLYQKSEGAKPFALPSYPLLLGKYLTDLGLKKNQFEIIEVPLINPIILTESKIVLSNLSKKGMRSAILLADGFRTRRSYWAYKQLGLPVGIEIIPYPYFGEYQKENWWRQDRGIHDYGMEFLTFFYSLLRGDIPLKSLLAT